jgi:hypothetical protein
MFELTRRQLLQTGVAGLCAVPFLAEVKAEEPPKVVDVLIGTHFQLEQVLWNVGFPDIEVTLWYDNGDEKTYIGNKKKWIYVNKYTSSIHFNHEKHHHVKHVTASSNRLYYGCTNVQVHKSHDDGYDIYLRMNPTVAGTHSEEVRGVLNQHERRRLATDQHPNRDSVIVMTGFQEVKHSAIRNSFSEPVTMVHFEGLTND